MITVVDTDKKLTSYKSGATFVDSDACPAGDKCTGDKGGRCIVRYDTKNDVVLCLNSFPPGISWSDCICSWENCEHSERIRELTQAPPTKDEKREAARVQAKAAAIDADSKQQE